MTSSTYIRITTSLFILLLALDAAAQWKQLPIPSIHGKIGSGTDGTLFVLTNGTLCYSDPGKNSWTYQPFPYDLNNQRDGLTFADPPRQLLTATDDTLVFVAYYGDVYYIVRGEEAIRSSMEGLKSKIRMNPMPYILRSRGKQGELLLCHDDFYESINNGVSWKLRYKHPVEGYSFAPGAVDEQNRDVLFLYEWNVSPNIHKSTDNGATWRIIPTHGRQAWVPDMLVCPDGQMYAGRFYSKNHGETWTDYQMDPDRIYWAEDNQKYIFHEQTHGVFAINIFNGLFFRDLDDPLFRKTALASSTLTESLRRGVDLSYEKFSGRMYAVINDSLYEYHQGNATPLANTVFAAEITSLTSYNSSGDTLLLMTPHTTIKSTDAGRTWISTAMYGSGNHNRTALTFSKGGKNLIYTYSFPLPYSTWIIENGEETSKRIRDISSCKLTYDPFSTGTFYGGVNRVWKMTDSVVLQADANAVLYADSFVDSLQIHRLRCITFDERRQGVMLLGGLDWNDDPFLYRTDDLGEQWERISSIPLKQPPIEIIFDPGAENRILVLDPTGVYISSDDGATWAYRDPGLGVRKATCIALDPDNPANIALGVASPSRTEDIPQSRDDGGGVWMSSDGGDSWSKLPIEGLFNYNISHVLFLRNPKRVLVGTPCGAYEYLLDSTSSVVAPEKASGLHMRIWPNPGRGTIHIGYTLDAPSPVRIKVYDVLGRIVFSRTGESSLQSGHTFPWDASGLREGMYFVTLETRTGVLARRVVIMR